METIAGSIVAGEIHIYSIQFYSIQSIQFYSILILQLFPSYLKWEMMVK